MRGDRDTPLRRLTVPELAEDSELHRRGVTEVQESRAFSCTVPKLVSAVAARLSATTGAWAWGLLCTVHAASSMSFWPFYVSPSDPSHPWGSGGSILTFSTQCTMRLMNWSSCHDFTFDPASKYSLVKDHCSKHDSGTAQ